MVAPTKPPLPSKQFNCDLCSKNLHNPSNLKRHVRAVHEGVKAKRVKCEACGRMLAGNQSLKRHYKTCRRTAHLLDEMRANLNKPESPKNGDNSDGVQESEMPPDTDKSNSSSSSDSDSDRDEGPSGPKKPRVKRCFKVGTKRVRTNTRKLAGTKTPEFECGKCVRPVKFVNRWLLVEHDKRVHPEPTQSGADRWYNLYGLDPEASESDTDDDDRDTSNLDIEEIIDRNSPTLGGLISVSGAEDIENATFDAAERSIQFQFTPFAVKLCANQGRALEVIQKVLDAALARMMSKEGPNAIVIVRVDSRSLNWPITDSLRLWKEFSTEDLLERIEKTMGSSDTFGIHDQLVFKVRVLRMDVEAAGKLQWKHCATADDFCQRSRSTFDPGLADPSDQNCFGRAVAAGILTSECSGKVKKARWYRDPCSNKKLFDLTQSLYTQAGANPHIPAREATIDLFGKMLEEKYGVQLNVYDRTRGSEPVYSGSVPRAAEDCVNIAITNNHAFLILDLKGWMGKRRECAKCGAKYSCASANHRCPRACRYCTMEDCDSFESRYAVGGQGRLVRSRDFFCTDCDRFFDTQKCMDGHRSSGMCEKKCSCPKCFKLVTRAALEDGDHYDKCCKRKCSNCKEYVPYDHLCAVQPVDADKLVPDSDFTFLFWDAECFFDREGTHQPYIIIADRVCAGCIKDDRLEPNCARCIKRRYKFGGRGCVAAFCNWLLFEDTGNKDAIAFSHNGAKYDNYLVLRHLLNEGHTPELISSAGKILSLKAGANDVEFKDSFLFVSGSLNALGETFGVRPDDPELHKSFFPHWFARSYEDLNYVGPMLDKFYYRPPRFTPSERERFDVWYKEHSAETFDLLAFAAAYCGLDVSILRRSMVMYRELCLEHTKIDPLYSCLTIAGVCSKTYRAHHLVEGTLGLCPVTGYTEPAAVQSKIAIKYIEWLNSTRSPDMQLRSAVNGKEVRLPGVRGPVDAYDPSTNTVIEVAGCFYHSCSDRTCAVGQKQREQAPHPLFAPLTHREVQEKMMHKLRQIELAGYSVELVYEHEIHDLKRSCSDFASFLGDDEKWQFNDNHHKIEPRSALCGGRTEVFRMVCELSPKQIARGWRILHYDITSMYPYVMKTCPLPIGHPTVINGPNIENAHNFTKHECDKYFGVISATVIPPIAAETRIPLLPYRAASGKLSFPCCRVCADANRQRNPCDHTDEGRSWTACYCTPELSVALANGYRVERVHQIWNYEKGSRDDLFRDYIKTWLKIKTEASGLPRGRDVDQFIKEFHEREGVVLEREELLKPPNPGKRKVAKLMLNSLWGKFAQRVGLPSTRYFTDPAALRRFVTNPQYVVLEMDLSSPKVAMVRYTESAERLAPHSVYSPVVASFVTAHSRVMLWKTMSRLGDRMIYGDTDSVLFKWLKGLWRPELSDFLGDWTDELGGAYIDRFYATGCKSYSYHTSSGKTCVKAKGLSLRGAAAGIVDLEVFSRVCRGLAIDTAAVYDSVPAGPDRDELVEKHKEVGQKLQHDAFVLAPDPQIARNRAVGRLWNQDSRTKVLRRTYDKSVIVPELGYRCLPFGWTDL